MSPDRNPEERLVDRRVSVRLPIDFEVALTDHLTHWSARGRDFSPEGCSVQADAELKPGDELRVELAPAWGAGTLEVDGRVVHATRGALGIAFDVARPAMLEATLDRYDRLQLADPSLGLLATRSPRSIAWHAILRSGGGTPMSREERRFLSFVDGHRSLAEIRRSLGADWESHGHLAIALLHRGLVRVGEASAARPVPVARANVRPAQAERYLQQAISMRDSGDRRQARLNAQLAASLAPDDLEIAKLLEALAD